MSNDRKALIVVLLLAFGAVMWIRGSVYSEPPTPPAPNLVFVTGGSGAYWQATIDGAEAAAKEFKAKLLVKQPSKNDNVDAQLAVLKDLDPQSLDGMAISPIDATAEGEAINRLCESLRVVTYDSDAPDTRRMSHVGTSNFSAGRTCARLVGEAMPEGGKIAVFLSTVTKENISDRKGGFAERIAAMADDEEGVDEKYSIVGYVEDQGNDDSTREQLRKLLSDHPDMGCLVALNARIGPLLLDELAALDKLGSVKLVTFDANDETLDGIEQGHIYATIAQDPYKFGYEAVNMLVQLCQGEGVSLPIVGNSSVYVGTEAVTKEKVSEFRQRLASRAAPQD